MIAMAAEPSPILTLPNELLIQIFSFLSTPRLLPLASVSSRLSDVTLGLIRIRLIRAVNLEDSLLQLECYPPSKKHTEPPIFCTYIGTDGLDTMSHSGPPADDIRPNTAKELKRLGCLYSRFHLTRQKPIPRPPPRQPPGDIPGSRTWELAMSSSSQATKEITHTVKQKVVLEAGDVLMQFCAATSLVKPHTNRGLVSSSIQLSEGIMRIWRHWLSVRSKETSDSGRSETAQASPKDDERILWANDGQNDVGLKLRVRQQKNKGGRPVLFGSEDESSVSYSIEYEELLIRTSLLLLKSEQAREKRNLGTGKAVLFGSLRRAPTQTQDS